MTDMPTPAPDLADFGRAEPFAQSFVGVAVLLGVVAVSEPLLFGVGYYHTLSIHPYWVAVLLAASQHGLAVGLATVALATVLLGAPLRPVGVDATVHIAQSVVLPVQWLAITVILGSYRQRQLRETEALWQRNDRLARMNETLAREVDRMDTMLSEVERSAASQGAAAAPSKATVPLAPPAAAIPAAAIPTAVLPARSDDQTHHGLAALATASIMDLPAALERAADALLGMPVLLVLHVPGEDLIVIDTPQTGLASAQAARLLKRFDGVWTAAMVSRADLGMGGDADVLVRVQTRAAGHDLQFALIALPSAPDDAGAQALAARLDVLGTVVRLWVDRFAAELDADAAEDAPTGQDA